MVSVSGCAQAYLLLLVVKCSGVEHIPYALVLDDGGSLCAAHLPGVFRFHQRSVRGEQRPFVRPVVASVRGFRHSHYLVGGGRVPGSEQEDQLVLDAVYLGIDGPFDRPVGFGNDYRPVAGVREGDSILAHGVPDVADTVCAFPGALVEDMDLAVEFPDAGCHGTVDAVALGIPQVEVADPGPVDKVLAPGDCGMPVREHGWLPRHRVGNEGGN